MCCWNCAAVFPCCDVCRMFLSCKLLTLILKCVYRYIQLPACNICPSCVFRNYVYSLPLDPILVIICSRVLQSGRPWRQRRCQPWWTTCSRPSSTPLKPPRVREAEQSSALWRTDTHCLMFLLSARQFVEHYSHKSGKSFNLMPGLGSLYTRDSHFLCRGINSDENLQWQISGVSVTDLLV